MYENGKTVNRDEPKEGHRGDNPIGNIRLLIEKSRNYDLL